MEPYYEDEALSQHIPRPNRDAEYECQCGWSEAAEYGKNDDSGSVRWLRHIAVNQHRRAQQCSACQHVTCSRCGCVVPPDAQEQFRSHVCAVPYGAERQARLTAAARLLEWADGKYDGSGCVYCQFSEGHDADCLVDAARGVPPQEFCSICQTIRESPLRDEALIRELVEALDVEIGLHPYEADVPTSVLKSRDKGRARLKGGDA